MNREILAIEQMLSYLSTLFELIKVCIDKLIFYIPARFKWLKSNNPMINYDMIGWDL